MYLEILTYIQNKAERLSDLQKILSLSNRQNEYPELYIQNWPDEVFFACDLETKQTLGYLTGCHNTTKAAELFPSQLQKHLVFSEFLRKYPAHVKMNCHPKHLRQGVGTFLLQEYFIDLKKMGVRGAHVVIPPTEYLKDFFIKNKFHFSIERTFENKNLLFMGISL